MECRVPSCQGTHPPGEKWSLNTFSLSSILPFKGLPLKALSAEQKRCFEGEHKSSLVKEIALFHSRASLPVRGVGMALGTGLAPHLPSGLQGRGGQKGSQFSPGPSGPPSTELQGPLGPLLPEIMGFLLGRHSRGGVGGGKL